MIHVKLYMKRTNSELDLTLLRQGTFIYQVSKDNSEEFAKTSEQADRQADRRKSKI